MTIDIKITVNGRELAYEKMGDLMDVLVDTDLFLPAMFSFTLLDSYDDQSDNLTYGDKDDFKIGAEVKIEVETDEIWDEPSPVKETVFEGEITSIEPFFSSEGEPYLRVRGYDRSHRLTRGKKTRTYGDGSNTISEQDIISTIVQEAGLSKDIDTSGISSLKYAYLMQYNQSDWEFLWSRARMAGYQVYVEDKKLFFQKANKVRGSTKPSKQVWGTNLSTFEPRMSIMNQVTEATATGWDPDTKKAVTSTVKKPTVSLAPETGISGDGGGALKKAFGEAEDVFTSFPLRTADQAKVLAGSVLSGHDSNFIQADGACGIGDPRLAAGRQVDIENVGKRFSGKYTLTRVTHRWQNGEYDVNFSAAGSEPNTILSILSPHGNGDLERREFGMVPGIVTNLDDPDQLGRVRVKFPWLPKYKGAELESNWARVVSPSGGSDRGFLFLPEIDDEVMVAFENGNLSYPYVVGIVWNKKDKPPKGTKSSLLSSDKKKVDQRVIRSRSGHLIVLDDTQGSEMITIQDKSGNNSFVINSKDNSITINSNGDFTINAKGKFIVNSTGDFKLDSKGGGSLTSTGAFKIESKMSAEFVAATTNQLSLKAAGAELKGIKVDVKADTVAAVNGNAMVEIKGALVKIN